MKKLIPLGALALATALVCAPPPALAKKAASPVATLDTDNDGTVDLAETKKAAESLFDRIEKDADGTLDKKEVSGRLSRKDFKAADPDNDGTLTKDEFLNAVEALFKSADPDNDGTLDEKEFKTKQGKDVVRVTR